MGWRDHALRLLAEGRLTNGDQPLDPKRMVAVFDRIDRDDALSARLDELDASGVRGELIALYHGAAETAS